MQEEVDFSALELQLLQRLAERMGFNTVQETAEFLAKQGLAKRANRPVRVRTPSEVVPFRARRKA